MLELTLTNGAALMLGLLGLAFTSHGMWWGFIDEVVIGGVFFLGAWWLL